ncbi:hypothetical protein PTW35_26995 (plasmid) [Photobacterium sp. DA100]|uniref:hypothetical protein n=1 Tax=Photobacterium sp. DA100 TaxID=3027472 RepID=UPI002479937E|nr:hypothetical protein [Photobacterium sp. DA100]WEM44898.1 hypothetical protein PTW35_26995 [Photobacterium sp. DA100]
METNPLYSAYLGELYGIAFFTAFANKYSDDSHIHKWQLLINVEQITATKLKTELTSIGIPCPDHDAKMEQKGQQDAEQWLHRDWESLVDTLVNWVEPYALRYRQQAKAAAEHQSLYHLVAQHEDAIWAFLQAEQQQAGSGTAILEAFINQHQPS